MNGVGIGLKLVTRPVAAQLSSVFRRDRVNVSGKCGLEGKCYVDLSEEFHQIR